MPAIRIFPVEFVDGRGRKILGGPQQQRGGSRYDGGGDANEADDNEEDEEEEEEEEDEADEEPGWFPDPTAELRERWWAWRSESPAMHAVRGRCFGVVWARVRGYPWWPALVASPQLVREARREDLLARALTCAATRHLVFWYGSQDWGFVEHGSCHPFAPPPAALESAGEEEKGRGQRQRRRRQRRRSERGGAAWGEDA